MAAVETRAGRSGRPPIFGASPVGLPQGNEDYHDNPSDDARPRWRLRRAIHGPQRANGRPSGSTQRPQPTIRRGHHERRLPSRLRREASARPRGQAGATNRRPGPHAHLAGPASQQSSPGHIRAGHQSQSTGPDIRPEQRSQPRRINLTGSRATSATARFGRINRRLARRPTAGAWTIRNHFARPVNHAACPRRRVGHDHQQGAS